MPKVSSQLSNSRGVVGIVLLAFVLVCVIAAAGYYVYQVRSGGAARVTIGTVPPAVPSAITSDLDAAAAEAAGQAAEDEDLSQLELSDSDLQ